MNVTEVLVEEHQLILIGLECLEKMVEKAGEQGRLDAAAASTAVDFLQNFADGCHHAKEEARLFPSMEKRGFPAEEGPIGVMVSEHDLGRALVRDMAKAIEPAAAGEQTALEQFARNARDLIELLKAHIFKENHVLFPMAEQALPEADKTQLVQDFKAVEASAGGNRHAKYMQVIEDLCRQYGVKAPDMKDFRHIEEWFMQ